MTDPTTPDRPADTPSVLPFPPGVAEACLTTLLRDGALEHAALEVLVGHPAHTDASLAALAQVSPALRRAIARTARAIGPATLAALNITRDGALLYQLAANGAVTPAAVAVLLQALETCPASRRTSLLHSLLENPNIPLASLLPFLPVAQVMCDQRRFADTLAQRLAAEPVPAEVLCDTTAACLAARDPWLRQLAALTLVPRLPATPAARTPAPAIR